ncbi:MAG: CHAD domain-containing protein [Anaerolineae bacterium]|nr:CHAD domain-containing protein [Anaerolineae bacterium]
MQNTHQELIAGLQAQIAPIEPQDTMAEAGRKALLDDFVKMLHHEPGSRAGEDPEEVHDMRVATRRMRSTFRLLSAYYKPKAIRDYLAEMRKVAQALGTVRDLDVMIGNLRAFQEGFEGRDDLEPVIEQFDQRRTKARKELLRVLDKGDYDSFIRDFSDFVTKPGRGALSIDTSDVHPYQVRHLLPGLIFEHLAAVRAYESVLEGANDETLHALRIEFKRLRYAVSIFTDVLGGSINDFITELKRIQDHLGNMNDIRAAKERLDEIAPELEADALDALYQYVQSLDDERQRLRDGFDEVWRHFNTKTVQRQLANAVAGL